MKAILEFNLPEERDEHTLAVKAPNMYGALWDIDQWLRAKIKYEDRFEFQEVREQLHEILWENGFQIDEVR